MTDPIQEMVKTLEARAGFALDYATVGIVLGLLDGLTSDGRFMKIWQDADESRLTHVELGDPSGRSVRFDGLSLSDCLAVIVKGPPPKRSE